MLKLTCGSVRPFVSSGARSARLIQQAHTAVEKAIFAKVGGGDQLPRTSLTFDEEVECSHSNILLFA